MSEVHKGLVVLTFTAQDQWETWLEQHVEQTESVWLKFAKKSSNLPSITYEEARETAITYGWIDGLINSLSETHYLIKLSPRRPRSKWSKINRAIAEELIRSGRMHPRGLAAVDAAKADGRWDAAYDSPSKIKPPAEIEEFLQENREAREFYESLSSANRYAFLYRIQDAKREATKTKHIETMKTMLLARKTYH